MKRFLRDNVVEAAARELAILRLAHPDGFPPTIKFLEPRHRRQRTLELLPDKRRRPPDGWPYYFICKDGGWLCAACAGGQNGSLAAKPDLDPNCRDDWQWLVIGYDVHFRGPPQVCDHCGVKILSAHPELSAYEGEPG
jgi:hypothetical protein